MPARARRGEVGKRPTVSFLVTSARCCVTVLKIKVNITPSHTKDWNDPERGSDRGALSSNEVAGEGAEEGKDERAARTTLS